jgi:GNAT superfamily N-acetyltransferase
MDRGGRTVSASAVEIRLERPDSTAARGCMNAYFEELGRRFDAGFNPAISNSASDAELTPPCGYLLLAWLDGKPVGCGALKVSSPPVGEIKRMWVSNHARGLGVARRLLHAIEAQARALGLERLRLETNRTLVEAQSLYRANGYEEVAPFNDEPYAHHWFEKRLCARDPDRE